MRGSGNRPGPRIAMAYNEEYHDFFLEHGRVPRLRAYSNTAVWATIIAANICKVRGLKSAWWGAHPSWWATQRSN